MAESKIPWGNLVMVGGIGIIAYFMKDTLLSLVGKTGGTSDLPVCTRAMIEAGDPCRVASPFPYLPNVPVIPEDLVYQNPILCALGAKQYCPPEAPSPITVPPDLAANSQVILGRVLSGICPSSIEATWLWQNDPSLAVLARDNYGCML